MIGTPVILSFDWGFQKKVGDWRRRRGLVLACVLSLAACGGALADVPLGECTEGTFGLTRDGKYVYKLASAPFVQETQITVFDPDSGSVRQLELGSQPISNTGTVGPLPERDNRVGANGLYFPGGGSSIQIASLYDMKVRTIRVQNAGDDNSAPAAGQLARPVFVVEGHYPVRLTEWTILPAATRGGDLRIVHLGSGSSKLLYDAASDLHTLPTGRGDLLMLMQSSRSCFATSARILRPVCVSGEVEEVLVSDNRVIVATDRQLIALEIDGQTIVRNDLDTDFSRLAFDPESFRLTGPRSEEAAGLLKGTRTTALFRRPVIGSGGGLLMADAGLNSGLILREEGGIPEVVLVRKSDLGTVERVICR